MAKANQKFKFPKWLAVLLWVIVVFAAYVGISCRWHSGGKHSDWPFSEKLGKSDSFDRADGTTLPGSIIVAGDNVFYDFSKRFRKLTNPLQRRNAQSGNPYFANTGETWDTISAHLRALNEPSLYFRKDKDNAEYFRFTLIHQYAPTLSYRITMKPDSDILMTATLSSGESREFPDGVQFQKTFALKGSEFDELVAESQETDFWNPFTELEEQYFQNLYGGEWFFESSTPKSYSAISISDSYFRQSDPKTTLEFNNKAEEDDIRETNLYLQLGIRFVEKYNIDPQ